MHPWSFPVLQHMWWLLLACNMWMLGALLRTVLGQCSTQQQLACVCGIAVPCMNMQLRLVCVFGTVSDE